MDQHTIPNCYLKAWCDPAPLPEKHTPFIWLISKNGKDKRKRAPRKAFTAADRYTIRTRDGQKILIAEHTLMATEDAFVRIRPKVEAQAALTRQERFDICAFAAAMLARSKGQGDHFAEFFRDIHGLVENLEKKRGAKPGLSLETRMHAENAAASTLAMTMLSLPQLLMRLKMVVFCTTLDEGFITSDCPCVMYDPEAYKLPPLYRGPALLAQRTELTLPLTPTRLLLFHHGVEEGYLEASQRAVDEANRRTRFNCTEDFVSHMGKMKDFWFDQGKEPEDSWEKSPEGIAAEEQRQRHLKARAEWEADVKRRANQDSPSQ